MLLGEHSLLRDGFTDKEYQCHTSKQVTCAVCRQHRSWGWSNPRQHRGDLHNTGRCCSRTWAICGWGRRVPEQPAASSGFCAELPPCPQAQGSTSAPLPYHICWDFLGSGSKPRAAPLMSLHVPFQPRPRSGLQVPCLNGLAHSRTKDHLLLLPAELSLEFLKSIRPLLWRVFN